MNLENMLREMSKSQKPPLHYSIYIKHSDSVNPQREEAHKYAPTIMCKFTYTVADKSYTLFGGMENMLFYSCDVYKIL